ncbi:MAG: MBL fold metallo-hydrolase [Anaerolineae bacterium]|nr:MBL fold metallo-hydrolase [Anaerolineae bacterium]
MKITFYGAARTVTGSQHMIEVNGQRILLDCGLYQGRRSETYKRNLHLPYDPASVDVMVLSHAHIDHSGNIPNLVMNGFRGDIICTHATRDLCATMLLDSGHIQERDVEFLNKKRKRRGEDPVEPIYTQEDAAQSLDSFIGQGYHRARTIAPGVTLTLRDAGHMLGSTIVVLDIEDREEKRDIRLVFSGDLGRKGIPIIRDPETIDRADVLIMESTYGNRVHDDMGFETKRIEQIIVDTYHRGGKVIIPAFAVGRTQQLVYMLHELRLKGDIPKMPIFVDSPLAINVTGAFRSHPECYDAEIREFISGNSVQDPFGFSDLSYTRTTEQSKQINFLREPAIVISASGMAENGRILHHLKNNIEDERNTILIVGFQAENTLGRRLYDGAHRVRIFGEEYDVRAKVETTTGLSGHADRIGLLEWVGAYEKRPDKVFLVHGELEPATALAEGLQSQYGISAKVPDWKQSFEV